ncbi:MAG: amino acid ABC transporter permease [Paracoccaceae bacterium]
MTIAMDPPKAGFRLSMLLYDTRYRSITIQVIFMILTVLFFYWLYGNVVTNLKAAGKDFSFGFLWTRSGYDINQMLVEYSSDSTHSRALLVGLLNTLFLSFICCILATVIGLIAGVLRLSKNVLVARLIEIYIETFRNVPVVLWIVLVNAIMAQSMPEPKEFRGEDPTATMIFFDSVAVTNRGIYLPEPLFSRSLGNTDIGIFLISNDLMAIIAVVLASIWAYRRLQANATAVQNATGVRPKTLWKGLAVTILPLVALLAATGFHLGYPELKGFNFVGGVHARNTLVAMWLALSIYSATYIAESVRGGILAISRGQTEAALALGLQPGLATRLVVLPQAMRIVVPPLISQYLSITKNTSLALAVGYMDLRSTLGGITMNQTGRELECMLLLMGIYLTISISISVLMNIYNNSIKLKER